MVRSVHEKLKGTFKVQSALPPELAQSLFAQSGTYNAYLRLSSNAGNISPDTIALPRGLAMKIVGVDCAGSTKPTDRPRISSW